MELAEIDFQRLVPVNYKSAAQRRAAARGMVLARKIYRDEHYFYKVWPAESRVWRTVYKNGTPIVLDANKDAQGQKQLPGFLYGLYDETIVPGFVSYIYSQQTLVGYITKAGEVLTPQDAEAAECQAFIGNVIKRSLLSRHILRDLHAGNVTRLANGQLSLIDLETPIAHLDSLDLNVEAQNGALRRGIFPKYRQFILDFFDFRCTEPEIIAGRSSASFSSKRESLVGQASVPVASQATLEDYMPSPPAPKERGEDILTWIAAVERDLARL